MTDVLLEGLGEKLAWGTVICAGLIPILIHLAFLPHSFFHCEREQ